MHYICKIEAPSTPDVNIELSAAQADWQLYRHGVYVSHTGPAQLTRRAKVRYYVKTKQSYFAYYIKYRIYFLNFLTQIDTYLQQKSFNQIIQPRSQVTFKFLTFIFNMSIPPTPTNTTNKVRRALSILIDTIQIIFVITLHTVLNINRIQQFLTNAKKFT